MKKKNQPLPNRRAASKRCTNESLKKQTTRMLTLKEDLLRQALNHATVFSKVLLLHGESQKVILHQ